MSCIFVVGAAGKVGRRLTRQLVQRDHTVLALHRHPDQAVTLKTAGAHPVDGSLLELTALELASRMHGADAVVFTAGAGGAGVELTKAVDGRGLELAVQAAEHAGVKRFLLVSVFPEALRGGAASEDFENYVRVKKLADTYLVRSKLDWVIIRPGTLLDSPGTGSVNVGLALLYGEVSRDDVAATLVAIIENPDISRMIIELTAGDTAIDSAVAGLLSRKRE